VEKPDLKLTDSNRLQVIRTTSEQAVKTADRRPQQRTAARHFSNTTRWPSSCVAQLGIFVAKYNSMESIFFCWRQGVENCSSICYSSTRTTRSIWKMLGPFTTASRLTPIHQMSLAVLSRTACASMSTTPTTTTTTTTRDRGDRYGPMEWAH